MIALCASSVELLREIVGIDARRKDGYEVYSQQGSKGGEFFFSAEKRGESPLQIAETG